MSLKIYVFSYRCPKNPNHPNTQSPPPEKQHERFAVLPHTKKFEVPEEFEDFLIYDSGTEDPERISIFGQQTLLELLESTQHLWLADGTLLRNFLSAFHHPHIN